MPTLTDTRFEALRAQGFTGATNDMILQWLHASGATSPAIPDAWAEVLIGLGYEAYQRNDAWYQYLGDQGYAGTLNDRELAFWIDGGVIGGGYVFNGSTQYATHAPWTVLGNPVAYPPQFAFVTDNPDGHIIDPTLPISHFGRVGVDYHSGSLSNLRYIDTSPLVDVTAYSGDVTIPAIFLSTATLSLDFIYVAGDSDILSGDSVAHLSVAGDVLSSAGVIRLDDSIYAGAPLVVGQHYRVEVGVASGFLDAVSGSWVIGNLIVNNNI